jgi:hypothetical protein
LAFIFLGTSNKVVFESPGPLVNTSRDTIRDLRKRKNVKVYRIDSNPLKTNELKDSLGENETFLVESLPTKLLKNLIETVKSLKERIGKLKKRKERTKGTY